MASGGVGVAGLVRFLLFESAVGGIHMRLRASALPLTRDLPSPFPNIAQISYHLALCLSLSVKEMQSLTNPITDVVRTLCSFKGSFERKFPSEKVTDDRLRMYDYRVCIKVSIVFARPLCIGSVVAPSDDDYEEGMVLLDTSLTFRGSRDGPSPYREEALGWAAVLADARLKVSGEPEHLEHVIAYVPYLMGLI